MSFYYVYVLRSLKDNNHYVGYTSDLRNRLAQHNAGQVHAKKARMPLELVYFEGCVNQQDATHREKYLKTSWGKRYLKERMKNHVASLGII